MKFNLILDPAGEESVTVIARESSPLTDAIEVLVCTPPTELIGYQSGIGIKLTAEEIHCIIAEDDRVYALTDSGKLKINERLYQIERRLTDRFVRINRSVIANLDKIRRFDASVTGTMQVTFCNGYRDYVSRRNLKHVKERLGL